MSKQNFQTTLQRSAWVALGAIALGLGSCAAPSTTGEAEAPESEVAATPEDALQVVTTFLPVTQFTNAVAGDRAEVVQLLPTNVGPHEYQAKPGDAQAIANADVLVKNGLEMEFFLDDMIENAGNADQNYEFAAVAYQSQLSYLMGMYFRRPYVNQDHFVFQ